MPLNRHSAAVVSGCLIALLLTVVIISIFLRSDGHAGVEAISTILLITILLTSLVCLVTAMSALQLGRRNQALGLPPNSVRALLALSLIVVLSSLGTQFFNSMSGHPDVSNIIQTFTELNPDLIPKPGPGYSVFISGQSGDTTHRLYSGKVLATKESATADDMAKTMTAQLLTLVGAVVTFYFGSRSASEAAKIGAQLGASTDANTEVVRVDSNEPTPTGDKISLAAASAAFQASKQDVQIAEEAVEIIRASASNNALSDESAKTMQALEAQAEAAAKSLSEKLAMSQSKLLFAGSPRISSVDAADALKSVVTARSDIAGIASTIAQLQSQARKALSS